MAEEKIETVEESCFDIDGEEVSLERLVETFKASKKGGKNLSEFEKKAIAKRKKEQALKPYQAELIKLQKHLENTNKKMIILFTRSTSPEVECIHKPK